MKGSYLLPIYYGTCGWVHKEWQGTFYPGGMKPSLFLRHYATFFPMTEVKSTSESLPTSYALDGWYLQTPHNYVFCPHFPIPDGFRKINHKTILEFVNRMSLLREKLGPFVIDLSRIEKGVVPSDISAFLKNLPSGFRYVIKFPSSMTLGEDVTEITKEKGLVFCEQLSGKEKTLAYVEGAFFYWHFMLKKNTDKKTRRETVTNLLELIRFARYAEKTVYLTIYPEKYESVFPFVQELGKKLKKSE